MMPPLLTESVRLASLPSVAVAVRAVLAFDERCIHRPTRARHPQRRHHCGDRAENRPRRDLDDPALFTGLFDHGVGQPCGSDLIGRLGTTAFARPGWCDRLAIGVEDRLLVGRVAVGANQVHQASSGTTFEVLDHRYDVLRSAFSGDHAND